MSETVRTTVTLDPDVEARLRELSRERRVSFKAAINATLRAGLDAESAERTRRYRERPRRLGARPGIDLRTALALSASFEDAEAIRRLELRK